MAVSTACRSRRDDLLAELYRAESAHIVNLARILDMEDPVATLVFCRTRAEVDQLTETLNGRGYRAEALHGALSQEKLVPLYHAAA